MYDRPISLNNEPIGLCSIESDSLQCLVGEIMEMSRHCRGISSSIHNGLFGPQVQENKKEANVSCMADALKEIRAILSETIVCLENTSRKL